MAANDLVLAFTGASGAPYGVRLLEVFLESGRTVHLTISPAAVQVLEHELDRRVKLDQFNLHDLLVETAALASSGQVQYHHYQDFSAGIASGSFLTAGMVICPCSMGTAGAIANGLSQNLIHRAAEVHLKERRKLILVPRESPIHLIHARNLATVIEAGALVIPAMPSFYHRPKTLEEAVDTVVFRVLDQLGLPAADAPRWKSGEDRE